MLKGIPWEPSHGVVRQLTAAQRRRAVLVAAACATDAADLAELLAMLGLTVGDARRNPVDEPVLPRNGPPPELLAELAAFAVRVQEEADEKGHR